MPFRPIGRGPSAGLFSALVPLLLLVAACGVPAPGVASGAAQPGAGAIPGTNGMASNPVSETVSQEQVLRGRQLVMTHDCAGCHGGGHPAGEGWLAGNPDAGAAYVVGPYSSWARNLTPDEVTGLGRFSERQIFNALRHGLRPSATPDREVTSATPGEGNHPLTPDYLSPAMPWSSWRHMSDEEIWAIAAYLRHGLRPVANPIPDAVGPPDRWASWSTPDRIGTHPAPAFPTAREELHAGADRERVLVGRHLLMSIGCGECHGGRGNPADDGWLVGARSAEQHPRAGPYERELQVGPFPTHPRNLTPDNSTGIGRFSERQIFNALRFGLRPGETADVDISSAVPGQGNHPLHPKYLPPSMPWVAWRHLTDEELWAIATYLKRGLKPVRNRVPDSSGPPDFWASLFTPENFGSYPAPAFPTERERRPE
jgi:mono/diheme cytochrome c family protein